MEFQKSDHLAFLQEITEVQRRSTKWVEEALEATIAGAPVQGTSTATDIKNQGLDDGAAVHGKYDKDGGAGMA